MVYLEEFSGRIPKKSPNLGPNRNPLRNLWITSENSEGIHASTRKIHQEKSRDNSWNKLLQEVPWKEHRDQFLKKSLIEFSKN